MGLPNTTHSESITAEVREDLLGIRPHASKIAQLLMQASDVGSPGIAAIYGKWGTGKTFLLKWVGKELSALGALVCCISAWEYEAEGDLASATTNSLLDINSYPSHNDDEEFKNLLETLVRSTARKTLLNQFQSFPVNIGGGVVSAEIQPAQVFKYLKQIFSKKSPPEVPSVRTVRKQFDELINKIRGDSKRLIIIIDDLDRCSPPNCVRFLEWLKNILVSDACTFVLAIDPDATARAVVGHYASYVQSDSKDIKFGMDYLNKLIDLHFDMQSPLAVDRLFLRLCESDATTVGKYVETTAKMTMSEVDITSLSGLLLAPTMSNPRVASRVARTFKLCLDEMVEEKLRLPQFRYLEGYLIVWLLAICICEEGELKPSAIGALIYNKELDKVQTPNHADIDITELLAQMGVTKAVYDNFHGRRFKKLVGEEHSFLIDLTREKLSSVISGINVKPKVIPPTPPLPVYDDDGKKIGQ